MWVGGGCCRRRRRAGPRCGRRRVGRHGLFEVHVARDIAGRVGVGDVVRDLARALGAHEQGLRVGGPGHWSVVQACSLTPPLLPRTSGKPWDLGVKRLFEKLEVAIGGIAAQSVRTGALPRRARLQWTDYGFLPVSLRPNHRRAARAASSLCARRLRWAPMPRGRSVRAGGWRRDAGWVERAIAAAHGRSAPLRMVVSFGQRPRQPPESGALRCGRALSAQRHAPVGPQPHRACAMSTAWRAGTCSCRCRCRPSAGLGAARRRPAGRC